MFDRFRRNRNLNDKTLRGIGGVPPFPQQGPVTALRILGQGYALPLDPYREQQTIGRAGPPVSDIRLPLPMISKKHALITQADGHIVVTDLGSKNGISTPYYQSLHHYLKAPRIEVYVGDRFSLAGVRVLALDEPTARLTKPLAAFCGPERDVELELGLEAVAVGHVLLLHGSQIDRLLDLARQLHDSSMRQLFPFTQVHRAPDEDRDIDELCTAAECGTVFLDMSTPYVLPPRLVSNLFGAHFHLGTIVATTAPTPEEVVACFGQVRRRDVRPGLRICSLGFPGNTWSPGFLLPCEKD